MSNTKYNPLEIGTDLFKTLYDLPIGELVCSRMGGGGFTASYLPWSHAVRLLNEHLPSVRVAFEEQGAGGLGATPVHTYGKQAFVMPYLTDGERRTPPIFFPVMDNRFNAIEEPSVRDISDACQRATVKAIATFTGLGLKLYTGEEIPAAPEPTQIVAEADRVVSEPIPKIVVDASSKGGLPKTKPKAKPKAAPKAKPKAAPKAAEADSAWGTVVIPFGKNKGKKLSELTAQSISWYHENYEADPNFPDNQILRDALDAWHAEKHPEEFTKQSEETIAKMDDPAVPEKVQQAMDEVEALGNTPIDDIAGQSAGDPTDPELDEEVPF